jgi:hypothetical protein
LEGVLAVETGEGAVDAEEAAAAAVQNIDCKETSVARTKT